MQAEHLPVHGQADYSLTSQEAKSFSDRDDERGLTGLTLPIAVFGGLGGGKAEKREIAKCAVSGGRVGGGV
jgi:hypothetical protein